MSAMAFQIPGVSIVCPTVCSGVEQRIHQSSASLAFVRGIHRWPVDSPHKGPGTRKMFPFDDVMKDKLNHKVRSWEHMMQSTAMLALLRQTQLFVQRCKYGINSISVSRGNYSLSISSGIFGIHIKHSHMTSLPCYIYQVYITGLMQKRRNSSALAMELHRTQ